MISGSELRRGVIIELEDKLYQVIEYQHVKMKRTALAKVKLRDIQAGHTIERSFQSNDRLTRAAGACSSLAPASRRTSSLFSEVMPERKTDDVA